MNTIKSAAFFLFFPFLLIATGPQDVKPKKLIFLDGIEVVFRGSEGNVDLITHTELLRMELDGSRPNLEKKIADLAFAQEAKKWRLWPSPEEIDKQVQMLAESNKKTPAEFDDLLMTIGFTPQEGRMAFAQLNAVNSLINFKVTANLIVPESQVIAYYNDHPEVELASYYVQYVFVPFAQTKTPDEQLKALELLAKSGDRNDSLSWEDPFWIKEDQLAQDKQFITQLAVGQISEPVKVSTGFELFRLMNKKEERLKSLDERYGEIATILRKPKYSELMSSFQKELLDNASIIYFDLSKYQ